MELRRILKVIVVLFAFLLIIGCSKKQMLSEEEFNDEAKKLNFEIRNISNELDREIIMKAVSAVSYDFSVEYYISSSKENADKVLNFNKDKIFRIKKTLPENDYKETKKAGNDYYKYTLSTDKIYSIVSKIENSVMYATSEVKNKKNIDLFFEKMGY